MHSLVFLVVVLLLGVGAAGAEEPVVAELDLKFIKETDKTAAVVCLGGAESDCTPNPSW